MSMELRGASGDGFATIAADGRVLNSWFLRLSLVAKADKTTTVRLTSEEIEGSLGESADGYARHDDIRNVDIVSIRTDIGSLESAPTDVHDAYLRLHLLSHRLVQPNCLNLEGIFSLLPNVVWTTLGPCECPRVPEARILARKRALAFEVAGVDKFPRMTDYVTPADVRIADADRVRLGAHLAPGTTVMHEGFCNFNAGTLGPCMVEGRISADQMIAMNARARLDRVPEAQVAADFLAQTFGVATRVRTDGLWRRLGRTTVEHLWLVGISLAAAILLGIPLGILAARRRRIGQGVLAVVGIIQTVPSLALLVFMIPLLGIGAAPAVAALFLYALLPIVRNTHAGLTGIAPELRDSAKALGLPSRARLWRVELPLASPSILAGIRTSAVITVGTATLGALIGAGGYGQPILTGIRLADVGLILEGAIPAALLAIVVEALFTLAERVWVPRGLRL